MKSEGQSLSLIERIRENDRTNAMREIMLRAPAGKSRADLLAGEEACAAEGRRDFPQGVVPALANSLLIISLLNSRAPEPQTLADISRLLGITKSHCHSILRTLVYFDWVRFDDRRKTYELQPSALSDVSSLLNSPALETIRVELATLVEETDVPCVLAQPLADRSFVVIDTFRSRNYVQVYYPVGHRFPSDAVAHLRVMLAWSDAAATEEYIRTWRPHRYTSRTATELEEIRAEVARTRARGYALSVGEFTDGMTAIAAPIFGTDGGIAYIASFSFLLADRTFDEKQLAAALRKALQRIHAGTRALTPSDWISS
ncbi:IclR family transcriptional regulator [Amaricoccus solimangrovi]|nr:IclR family transcriptional regulator [Amaricoccus solimangrovi]